MTVNLRDEHLALFELLIEGHYLTTSQIQQYWQRRHRKSVNRTLKQLADAGYLAYRQASVTHDAIWRCLEPAVAALRAAGRAASSGKVVKKAKKATPKAGDVLAGLSQYPEIMRPEEVQEVLRISRATFFRMIESGKLKGAVRVGGSWRCVRDVLRQWLIDQAS